MEPTSPGEPPCLHVFAIPELVHLICALTSKRDNASLLRVCRQLFDCVRPFVWEYTNSNALVSMIPGVGMVTQEDGILPSSTVMVFPYLIDRSRLDVYAPLVKRLDIIVEAEVEDSGYEGWDEFLADARVTKLLPNLTYMNVRVTGSIHNRRRYGIKHIVNWTTLFISPSLLSLVFAPNRVVDGVGCWTFHWLDFNEAHDFLDNVRQQCPLLQSLEILPSGINGKGRNSNRGSTQTNSLAVRLASKPAISNFTNLRSLTTSSFVLTSDIFLGIACLPFLDSLVVYGLYLEETTYGSGLTLPDRSFSALRHLELQHVAWSTIQHLTNQPLLLRNLHTLKIHGYQSNLQTPSDLFSTIISQLVDHRSRITSLRLSNGGNQSITLQMIQSLKTLPLRYLYLNALSDDHSNLEDLIRATPALEDLTITSDRGYHLTHLQMIITLLPNLHRLSLNMEARVIEEVIRLGPPSQPLVEHKLCLESDFDVCPGGTPSIDPETSPEIIARYLCALNPHIEYGHPDWGSGPRWVTDEIVDALSELRDR